MRSCGCDDQQAPHPAHALPRRAGGPGRHGRGQSGARPIGDYFHAGVGALQWVVDSYNLVYAVLLLTGGLLADLYGRRRIFMIGVAIFTAASLLCAAAPSIGVLIAGRALAGLGAALLVPASLAIIRVVWRDEAERGHALGIWAGCNGLAMAIGPTVGGLLIGSFGWRSIFLVVVPFGLAALALARPSIPESSDPQDRQLRCSGPGARRAGAGRARPGRHRVAWRAVGRGGRLRRRPGRAGAVPAGRGEERRGRAGAARHLPRARLPRRHRRHHRHDLRHVRRAVPAAAHLAERRHPVGDPCRPRPDADGAGVRGALALLRLAARAARQPHRHRGRRRGDRPRPAHRRRSAPTTPRSCSTRSGWC